MPKLTRIYTRTGDDGTTGLVGGQRVKKNALRIDTYGTIDELSSVIGLARSALTRRRRVRGGACRCELDAWLAWTQDVLFNLGSELATLPDDRWEGMPLVGAADAAALERAIDRAQTDLEPLANFIHPGGSQAGAFLHLARTVARRAERLMVTLAEHGVDLVRRARNTSTASPTRSSSGRAGSTQRSVRPNISGMQKPPLRRNSRGMPEPSTGDSFVGRLFSTTSLESLRDASRPAVLRRALRARDLIAVGLGTMIGGGIFTTIGPGVKQAGPAIILAFVLAGLASFFAALCYAELGAMVPIAGSAYTYAYATLGQLVAWIIGFSLIFEYGVSAAPVAQQFSSAFQGLLKSFGLALPAWAQTSNLIYDPHAWWNVAKWDFAHSQYDVVGALFVLLLSVLLSLGIRETAAANNTFVVLEDRRAHRLRRRRGGAVPSRKISFRSLRSAGAV